MHGISSFQDILKLKEKGVKKEKYYLRLRNLNKRIEYIHYYFKDHSLHGLCLMNQAIGFFLIQQNFYQ